MLDRSLPSSFFILEIPKFTDESSTIANVQSSFIRQMFNGYLVYKFGTLRETQLIYRSTDSTQLNPQEFIICNLNEKIHWYTSPPYIVIHVLMKAQRAPGWLSWLGD